MFGAILGAFRNSVLIQSQNSLKDFLFLFLFFFNVNSSQYFKQQFLKIFLMKHNLKINGFDNYMLALGM